MPSTQFPRSSLSSLVASRRRRRTDAEPASSPAPFAASGILSRLARTGPAVLEGHVFDAADPDRRFVVELVLDGLPTAIARAELFDASLKGAGGDNCHGFCFHLDPALLPALRTAAVRLANTHEAVGESVDFTANDAFAASTAPDGGVEWTGGLALSGWVRRDAASPFPATVEAWIDGARVAWTRASAWRSVSRGGTRTAEPGFAMLLPREIADGRAKRVDVVCDGKPLPGSPVCLIAYPDGLRAHLLSMAETQAEAEPGRLFDETFPGRVPFASLPEWETRFPLPLPAQGPAGSVAIVVVGAQDAQNALAIDTTDERVDAMLALDGADNRFVPGDLLAFLAAETRCEAVLFVVAGAEIRPFLVARLLAALAADRGAGIAYCDVLLADGTGGTTPFALPAFDYERALEQGIGSTCFMMRREAAIAAAGRGVDDLHRLFLSPLETAGIRGGTHLHVPGFGAVLPPVGREAEVMAASVAGHLAARGRPADVVPRPGAALPAVRVSRRFPPRPLALVLEAGSDPASVRPALEALESQRGRKDMRIVVAMSDAGEDLRQALQLAGMILSETPAGTSPARRMAAAFEMAAPAELVCVLDARLRPAAPDWLDELLGRFAEDDVGAVAPIVLDSAGLVAGAGLVLDPAGRPLSAFAGRRHGDPGYGDALLVARQASSFGPACFLTRRADFLALGGFDPILFPDRYGAADYGLKLQALGRRIVVSPDAVLAFAAGTDAEPPELPGAKAAREREERALLARWPDAFARDPFASPLLNRGSPPFDGLAWPPGDRSPRHPGIAPARAVPPGW